MQDLFHSTTHWLKATGILKKFLDNYMDAEPYIPQPKENINEPLVFLQLMMLWFIWIGGLTVAIFAFFGEITAGGIAKKPKKITWTGQRQDNAIQPMPQMPVTRMTQNQGAIAIAIHGNGKENPEEIHSTNELGYTWEYIHGNRKENPEEIHSTNELE